MTLVERQIFHLRRRREARGAAWYEPQHARSHPSATVRGTLEDAFGALLDPSRSVVHSTAWRYEPGHSPQGRLVLTYLAVLPPWCGPIVHTLDRQWSLEPVSAVEPARSAPLAPPEHIALAHVLAHALDHLALLFETDPAIAGALGRPWQLALAERAPCPAGERPLPSVQTACRASYEARP